MNKELNQNQNKKMTIFACCLSIISIMALVFGFTLVSSDKVVMLQSISNIYNKVNNIFDEENIILNKVATNDKVGLNSIITLTKDEQQEQLILNYLENKNDKLSKLELELKNQEELSLDGNILLQNNKLFLFLNNITDSYYNIDLNYVSILSGLETKDYDKLLTIFKESFDKNIKKEDITKEKVTINYLGNNKKVNKLSYQITPNKLNKLMNDFISSVKNNKNLYQNIKLLNVDIDNLANNINYNNYNINYNVYYYGFNKIIGYELVDNNNGFKLEYEIEDKEIINFYDNDNKVFSLNVIKTKNKNEYQYNGFIKINNNNYNFDGSVGNNSLTLKIDNKKIILEQAIDESKFSINYVIKISITNDDKIIDNYVLTMENNLYFNSVINEIIENSNEYELITEDENNKLKERYEDSLFYELLNNLNIGL